MTRYAKQLHPRPKPHREPQLTTSSKKDYLRYYFDNLAAAATTDKFVLDQLTSAIAMLTTINEALIATDAKLTAEVKILTKKLGRNTRSKTISTASDKRIPRTCPHCKKEGFHKTDTCFELGKNASKRPPNWKSSL